MKKIIQHPIVNSILTLVIAYFIMEKYWVACDFLIIDIPRILGINLESIMGEDLFYTWFVYFEFIGIWICGLIIILVFKSYRPMLKAFSPKLKGNNIRFALIGGLLLGFGLNILIALVAIATGAIQLHYVGLSFGAFVLLLIAVFIQSGAEEFIARVFIYQRLRRNFPKWPAVAILVNGLFFVVIHLFNPGVSVRAIIMVFVAAIIYSLIIYYYDSIWVPIVAHTTWNFTQSIVLGLPNSGIVFPVSMFRLDAGTANFAFDPTFGIEGAILAISISIVVGVGVYILGKKKGAQETNIWGDEC